jgi:hypothetical protein
MRYILTAVNQVGTVVVRNQDISYDDRCKLLQGQLDVGKTWVYRNVSWEIMKVGMKKDGGNELISAMLRFVYAEEDC